MKIDHKKLLWVLVSCLMALSLIIASCGSKETTTKNQEEDTGQSQVVITETEVGGETTGGKTTTETGYADPAEPKYGGTFSWAWFTPQGFDPYYTFMVSCSTLYICNEELLMGDWSKTPAGDGSAGIGGFLGFSNRLTGQLCESWSMPDSSTLLFNIRHGVHWFDKPPVNGREYDAYDAEWAINHLWETPVGAHQMIVAPDERITSATALDKWTLEVKMPPQAQGLQAIYTGSWLYQYPKDVVDAYGDMKDWRNVIGTGPYTLEDYVTSSVLTFKRNPNYWQHDPIHPENQLPYLDTLKWMIISDASTQLAAFRTGQLDFSMGVTISHEDGDKLLKDNPELKYITNAGFAVTPYFRVDKPELPFHDVKVRQALTLTINKQELIDDYYNGFATLDGQIYPPDKPWEPFYTPLDEMPSEPFTPGSGCSVQELFTYNDTTISKAKQLMVEAGYPDGFKCQIITNTPAGTDFLSIIKEYFAKINVELEIQQLEPSMMVSLQRGRTYEEGIYAASPTAAFPYDMHSTRKESFDDLAYYESDYTRQVYNVEREYVMKDDAKYAATLKESVPFILEQCVGIWCPVPRTYLMWWPWVQNYHGEGGLGCDDELLVFDYIWMDKEMKTGMGY
jgi:peptide/nickel transport system substrate-binding protein